MILLCGIVAAGCASSKPLMAVAVPLVDLRAKPHTSAQPNIHDPDQETQLFYGEQVRIITEPKDGWAYVEALEQPEFSHGRRWQGYPGWIPSDTLTLWQPLLSPTIVVTHRWATTWTDAYALTPSRWRFAMGTRLYAQNIAEQFWRIELFDGSQVWLWRNAARSLKELQTMTPEERRRLIIRYATELLGDPYYWGGRSPRMSGARDRITGLDCSGLINIVHRAAGVDVPRDAHEQFLRARSVSVLRPADLIFLSERDNPKRIVHVMLYAGEDAIIEGPGSGLAIRRMMLKERLGSAAQGLRNGIVVDGQTISLGTYLP